MEVPNVYVQSAMSCTHIVTQCFSNGVRRNLKVSLAVVIGSARNLGKNKFIKNIFISNCGRELTSSSRWYVSVSLLIWVGIRLQHKTIPVNCYTVIMSKKMSSRYLIRFLLWKNDRKILRFFYLINELRFFAIITTLYCYYYIITKFILDSKRSEGSSGFTKGVYFFFCEHFFG